MSIPMPTIYRGRHLHLWYVLYLNACDVLLDADMTIGMVVGGDEMGCVWMGVGLFVAESAYAMLLVRLNSHLTLHLMLSFVGIW